MKIPLRERKAAQTRLRLARALAGRLEREALEAVAVRDLCEEVEVSEATFFNYFGKKTELLAYLGQLWSLELQWHAARAAQATPGLEAIQTLFAEAARQVQATPQAYGEWIALQVRQRERVEQRPLTPAERQLGFPDLEGIAALEDARLDSILADQLQRAIDRGELPANTPVQVVMASLVSLYFGVIVALKQTQPAAIGAQFRQQLHLLWSGLRTAAEGRH